MTVWGSGGAHTCSGNEPFLPNCLRGTLVKEWRLSATFSSHFIFKPPLILLTFRLDPILRYRDGSSASYHLSLKGAESLLLQSGFMLTGELCSHFSHSQTGAAICYSSNEAEQKGGKGGGK